MTPTPTDTAEKEAERLAAIDAANKEAKMKAARDAELKAMAEQKALDAAGTDEKAKKNEELNAAALREAERIFNQVGDEESDVQRDPRYASEVAQMFAAPRTSEEEKIARGQEAAEKLRRIAISYTQTAPNEHIIFGAAGIVYTLGDIRDLFGLPRS